MYTFEIEDDQFKFCKAEFKEGKFSISKLGVFERPFQSSVLKELQGILSEIERPVIFAVPRRKVSVHYHSFPSQREEEINQMARFQALRQFPYRELSVVHSAYILKKIPDGYSKVALTVVGEDILSRYLEDVKSFILPDKITVNSLGVFGFYKMARPGRDAVVIDLDNRFSNLCVIGEGKLLFCREINKGFYSIRDNGIDSWLDEVRHSVNSFNKERLYKNIEDLAVVGPKHIDILKKTELPFKNTEFIHQEDFIKKEDDFKFYGHNREKAHSLIKVLGLSAVDKLDIDLTPVSLAQALLKQDVFKQRKAVIIFFALAFFGMALLAGWEYQRKKIYLNLSLIHISEPTRPY